MTIEHYRISTIDCQKQMAAKWCSSEIPLGYNTLSQSHTFSQTYTQSVLSQQVQIWTPKLTHWALEHTHTLFIMILHHIF